MAGKQSAGVQLRITRFDLITAILLLGLASVVAFYFLIEPTRVELKSFASPIANEDYSFEYSIPEIDIPLTTVTPVVKKRVYKRSYKRCHVPKLNKCQRVRKLIGPR
jgi:hypothetical protein